MYAMEKVVCAYHIRFYLYVRMLTTAAHQAESHSHSHEWPTFKKMLYDLAKSKNLCEQIMQIDKL